jgi:hypothetical protein
MTTKQITDRRLDVYRVLVCTHPAEEGLLALDRLQEDGSVDARGPLLDRQAARLLAEALQTYASTGTLCAQCPKCRQYTCESAVWEEEMGKVHGYVCPCGYKEPVGYAG